MERERIDFYCSTCEISTSVRVIDPDTPQERELGDGVPYACQECSYQNYNTIWYFHQNCPCFCEKEKGEEE